MNIAVNTRLLIPGKLEGVGVYTDQILRRMVDRYSGETYHFYFDHAIDPGFLYSENVIGHKLFPPARHPVLFYVWFEWALSRALSRHKPDCLFSPDGFMPLKTKVPTVITIHDVAHQRYPDQVPSAAKKFYQYFMPKFVRKADHIITVSEFSKEEICRFYTVKPEKISVVYNGISHHNIPIDDGAQQKCRAQYAQERPYFVYLGSIHPRKNVHTLIKAFDLLKSRNPIPHLLLIAGKKSWQNTEVDQAFADSKYKQDIKFLGYVPQSHMPLILGSAEALCYLSIYEGFGLPVVEAMASGTPVICSNKTALSEIAGDAAMQVDPFNLEAVADAMIEISSNSSLRKTYVDKGFIRKDLFNWQNAADQTFAILMEHALK